MKMRVEARYSGVVKSRRGSRRDRVTSEQASDSVLDTAERAGGDALMRNNRRLGFYEEASSDPLPAAGRTVFAQLEGGTLLCLRAWRN
jgi:hypothetical protein